MQNKIYLFNVSDKLITERTAADGSKFYSVILPGICSFCVSGSRIFAATGNDRITARPGKKTILLGEKGTSISVRLSRIVGASDYGNPIFGYVDAKMCVDDISEAWIESRKKFFNNLAASQPGSPA